MKKICVDCKYHHFNFQHFCTHKNIEFPSNIDPVTGRRIPVHKEHSNIHPLCKDINSDGMCRLWEQREKEREYPWR